MRKILFIILFLAAVMINSCSVISQTIEIRDVIPHTPPILIPTDFSVVLDKAQSNLTYLWDFGDGSPKIITKSGILKHTYPRKGIYELKINVSGLNMEANKTVQINAISPKDYITSLIDLYRMDLTTIDRQINSLPEWLQNEVKKNVSITDLNSSLSAQEQRYYNATSDDEYADITKKLLEIKIPFSFSMSEEIRSMECFLNENQFDLEVLKSMGIQDTSITRENYFTAVELWALENIDITMESKTYSFYFRDKSFYNFFSHVKIKFQPLKKIDKLYFVINEDSKKIILKNETETKQDMGTAAGIIMTNLDRERNIEILYPGRISVLECPFYFSPDSDRLEKNETVIVCDNDGVCDRGENYRGCRNDCKPFKITSTLLIILFFSAFAIYIFLQEWYKKRYESKLFPNKNNLYNVMSFINNSLSQGLKKSDVFDKLKEMDWTSEQLIYAWKKFHGKRTGMFEIPIFKWFENRKIRKELENRNSNYIYKRGGY